VKKRLFDAYVNYAELAAKQNSPCLAEREYNSALALMNDATVAQKRAQVVAQCRQAISSPPTPVSGANGENYTWKISTGDGAPCTGIGDISGAVRDALGRLLTGVSVGYYADGIPLTTTKTNANGQYQFQLGKDAGIFHVVMLGGDGKTPANLAADVPYPGGANAGCHIVVDWQRGQ
jgi:hypothetical protein